MTLWQKIRPTVIVLSVLAASLAAFCVWLLIGIYSHGNTPSTEVLIALVGVAGLCVGSLLTLAGQVATDPPPPSIPAKEFPDVLRALGDFRKGGD